MRCLPHAILFIRCVDIVKAKVEVTAHLMTCRLRYLFRLSHLKRALSQAELLLTDVGHVVVTCLSNMLGRLIVLHERHHALLLMVRKLELLAYRGRNRHFRHVVEFVYFLSHAVSTRVRHLTLIYGVAGGA